MFPAQTPFAKICVRTTTLLLLAVMPGCVGSWHAAPSEPGIPLRAVKASELKPGEYCEIDMVVPPTSPTDSYQRYCGIVKNVTHEEVELSDTVEESWIEYGSSVHRRPPSQQKRGNMHVPLTGVEEIVVQDKAVTVPAHSSAKDSAHKP